jgi:hypothetical protein
MGGELIQKAGGGKSTSKKAKKLAKRYARQGPPPSPALRPSAQASLNSWDFAVANHTQALRGNGVDSMVTKSQLDRATTACQIEMVKMARRSPVALGDRGVINMMRPGGRP